MKKTIQYFFLVFLSIVVLASLGKVAVSYAVTGIQNSATLTTASTCTSFTYSDWSSCQVNGTRTRNVLSPSPAGCAGGNPVLTQSCTNCDSARPFFNSMNMDNCTNSKGIWNSNYCICSCPTGYRFEGTGCLHISTSTNVACTSFTYSDWSSCQNGIRTRMINSPSPAGCTTGNPILSETCSSSTTTVNNTSSTATGGTSATGSQASPSTNACSYIYSDWSSCQSGTRTRSVLSSLTGCTGTPVLSEACSSSTTTASNSTSSTTATVCTSFNYSDWSSCQINGTKTRTINSSYPTGCTGGTPVLSETCTYYLCDSTRPYLNDMNKENCTDSNGTWDSSNCSCSCPTGYKFEGTGCLYVPPVTCVFTYSDWTACVNGKQDRTMTGKSPDNCTGGQQESLTRYCLIDSTCQKDEWSCDSWTACANGKQTRTCKISFDCPGISEISPKTEQSCTPGEETTNTTTEVACSYKYSEYGECQNGKQYRNMVEKYPEGCVEKTTTEPLERTCVAAKPVNCSYAYSAWSECKDGKKTRSVLHKTPEACSEGTPVLEGTCRSICTASDWKCEDWGDCGSEGMQYRKCSLSPNCLTSSAVKPSLTTRSCVHKTELESQTTTTVPVEEKPTTTSTTEPPKEEVKEPVSSTQTGSTTEVKPTVKTEEEQLPAECIKVGWANKKDCELYLYHSRIISDCRNSGLSSQDQCRNYLLTKYGKPLKCEGMSDDNCNTLINNVILSELKIIISPEVKEKLIDVAGRPAIVDVQNKTITVQVVTAATSIGQPETKETKEVKMENLPIVSNIAQQVSVSLVSTGTGIEQQNLSPVAIAFDSDGDGLPDDVEKRLGTDPNNKDTDSDGYSDSQELQMGTDPLNTSAQKSKIVLSGVDRALVDGKTLEQPKYTTSTPSVSLAVNSVATVKPAENKTTSNLKFEGKAKPNQVITLFIYSTMPIVVTVQADSNGNWSYELDKTLVDGTHEAYVALNDNEGKIVEASLPTPFFIQEARAVSVDDFVATGDATQISNPTTNLMMLYVLSGLAVILLLVAAFLIIKQRFAE